MALSLDPSSELSAKRLSHAPGKAFRVVLAAACTVEVVECQGFQNRREA